jgi:UDP:flavonoid glycosyltransferase YjiC (YdhE family)
VAAALAARGHDVAFYTGSRARERVESEGYTHFAFQGHLDRELDELVLSPGSIGAQWTRPWRLRSQIRRFLIDLIPLQLEDLERVLEDWQPDVIACDPTIWAPFVVLYEAGRTPVAIVSYVAGCTLPGPDAPPIGFGFPPPRTWGTRLLCRLGTLAADLLAGDVRRGANALRKQYGLPPIRGAVMSVGARLPLFVVPSAPEFDYNRRDLPPSVHYVGPLCWYPQHESPAWLDALPAAEPVVHATEGTIHAQEPLVLRAAAHGLANLPMQVILSTGGNRDPAALGLGPLAPNVRIVRWINHSVLLPRTDVVVCTGGSGAVLAALQEGVPIVAVPTEWDHADTAQRIAETGVGLRLARRQCTPDGIRSAVQRVLADPSFRRNAERIAQGLRRGGGPGRAAELLEQLVPDPIDRERRD